MGYSQSNTQREIQSNKFLHEKEERKEEKNEGMKEISNKQSNYTTL